MAVRYYGNTLLCNEATFSVAFLNRNGNTISLDKVTIHSVSIKANGKILPIEDITFIGNRLNGYFNCKALFRNRYTKFNLLIEYSYKNSEDVLTFRKTLIFEPIYIRDRSANRKNKR